MIDPASITHDELISDPYPIYARLREDAPIAFVPQIGQWLVTRWDDCAEIGRWTGEPEVGPSHESDLDFFGGPSVLTMEGPKHEQLRVGIDSPLRPRPVKSFLAEEGRQVVIDALDELRPLGQADLAKDLFQRISVRVVGNRMGLNDIPVETLISWFHGLSDGLTERSAGAEPNEHARKSLAEIDDFMRERIARVTSEPDGSLISHMVNGGVSSGEPPRTFDEVMPSIRVICLGGFQEPGNACSNTFLGLFQNDAQLRDLQARPEELSAVALHESLRWIAPIGLVTRYTHQDVELAGQFFPKGAQISLAVASANRDPSRYENPDTYDLARESLPYATFGFGNHHCSGHFLAKGLGQIVVEETARRLPNLRPDHSRGEPVVSGYLFRGTESLPAVWDA